MAATRYPFRTHKSDVTSRTQITILLHARMSYNGFVTVALEHATLADVDEKTADALRAAAEAYRQAPETLKAAIIAAAEKGERRAKIARAIGYVYTYDYVAKHDPRVAREVRAVLTSRRLPDPQHLEQVVPYFPVTRMRPDAAPPPRTAVRTHASTSGPLPSPRLCPCGPGCGRTSRRWASVMSGERARPGWRRRPGVTLGRVRAGSCSGLVYAAGAAASEGERGRVMRSLSEHDGLDVLAETGCGSVPQPPGLLR